MNFWKQAFGWGWVTAEQLRLIVITEEVPFGELTKGEFKRITGENFDSIQPEEEAEEESPADPPVEDPTPEE